MNGKWKWGAGGAVVLALAALAFWQARCTPSRPNVGDVREVDGRRQIYWPGEWLDELPEAGEISPPDIRRPSDPGIPPTVVMITGKKAFKVAGNVPIGDGRWVLRLKDDKAIIWPPE